MTPANYKINDHYRGDTFDGVRFTLEDSNTLLPIDLTGATIQAQFRTHTNTGVIKKNLTIGSGITLEDAAGGVFVIDAFLLDWNPDIYYYDVQVVFPDSVVRTFVRGSLTIIQDTTDNG